MKKSIIAGLALCAAPTALGGKERPSVRNPSCVSGIVEASIACFRTGSNVPQESEVWVHQRPVIRPYNRPGHFDAISA
jgi:hypothetical protein